MPRLPVGMLLDFQRRSYELLFHLRVQAETRPAVLGPESVERLRRGETCAAWLESRRGELPAHLVPAPPLEHFANLLASYFDVSFDGVSVTAPDGHGAEDVRWSGVRRKRTPEMRRAAKAEVAIALRYQLSRDGTKLELDACRALAEREDLREAALVVAYVWELERRAIGKSKGVVAHRIWLNMSRETRTSLSEAMFEECMARLHAAARDGQGGA